MSERPRAPQGWSVLRRAIRRMVGGPPIGRVAFNMRPLRGPWGGSNAFVTQLSEHLTRRGYEVVFELADALDVIVLVDPRVDAHKPFGVPEVVAYRERHPEVRVLHRINECDQRKGTRFMDDLLRDANRIADYTVFISSWLRDYHADRWFDTRRPHRAIYNGADPRVFHPIGGAPYDGRGPLRLVTHHWSANPLKGFDVYREVDDLISKGELTDVELWVIGRWPPDLHWGSARTWPPMFGHDLARRLRACHGYLTASRWEPGGMHHVEGAQCGLPLIYHEDGGGIVEAGLKYGVGYRDDVRAAIATMRREYGVLRRRVLEQAPSGDRMCCDYADVIGFLASDRSAGSERAAQVAVGTPRDSPPEPTYPVARSAP